MADEPVSAWAEPWTRRLSRWLTRHRTGVTGAAAAVLAGVVGLSAVLAVQAQANLALADKNTALTAANAKIEARYNLAVEAIKTFHTGVSEDFLLKEEKFKELRDRLLKSASDFYGKLGALLGKDTDIASRRALAQSNFELADLTGKVGRNADALAAHRAVLAAREALAAEPAAGVVAKVDVGRSLTVVAGLLEATGKTDEALASYRRSESLLAGPAGADPSARAALAACRSSMGWPLFNAGKIADALAAFRLAHADQEALAAAPEASNYARYDLAETLVRTGVLLWKTNENAEAAFCEAQAIHRKLTDDNPASTTFRSALAHNQSQLGYLLAKTGKPAEAEAEDRKAIALYQKLADDSPAVTGFRSSLADSHFDHGILLLNGGKPAEAAVEYRKAVAIRQKLVDDNPPDIGFRAGLSLDYLRVAALQAWFGRDQELSFTCEKVLSLAKDTEDPPVAERAAKCCSLRQADPNRCETALVLARRAEDLGKNHPFLLWFQMALGMAEYRSGHFAEADAALIAAATGGKDNPRVVGA